MVIPAKQEALDKFTRKVNKLSKIVNKTQISKKLGIQATHLYSALHGNFGVMTYHNYCDLLDEYAREIIKDCEDILRIKKY